MNSKEARTAYIRCLDRTTQCDLTFWLNIKHVQYGTLDQEIKSLRQLNDSVDSLLNHTKNKVVKLFQDKEESEVDVEKLEVEMNISLSRNNEELAGNISCADLLNYKNKIQFRIFGKIYRVIVNAPLIFKLTIPKFIYANTCVKPVRLSGIHLHTQLSKYKWSKSKDKVKWTDVFYEANYNTTVEDINYYLKLTLFPYSKDHTPGIVVEAISDNVVDTLPGIPPNSPQTEYRKAYSKDKLCGKNVRVVTYNILAARYTEDQFEYCEPKFLSIDYRRQLIFEELMDYKADLICLQEVDLDQYHEYFKKHFKNNGYASQFFKKGHIIPEGLAFIFDTNRFENLECNHIVLSEHVKKSAMFKDIWKLIKARKEVQELFLKQHTSLLVATLKSRETNDIVIIANTHLYYHKEAGHIRLLQIAIALRFIKLKVQHIKAKGEDRNVSVILCGDFNSVPDSAVYQLLSSGKTTRKEDLESIGGDQSNVFKHNFNFTSACGTPEFTNYTEDFKGCLDYIFCQNHMKVTQVAPFPPEDYLASNTALPNQYFPSDHVALVADLAL